MHVAVFCDFDLQAIGGVQTSIVAQIAGLEAAGHTVTLVCPVSVEGYLSVTGRVIPLPLMPGLRLNGYGIVRPTKRLVRRLLKEMADIDVIHAQTNLGIGLLAIMTARRARIPLVQTMHGRDDVFVEKNVPFPATAALLAERLHRWFLPHQTTATDGDETPAARRMWRIMISHAEAADIVTVPSHHFAEKFKAHGCQNRIEVVSNGIPDTYRPMLEAAVVPRRSHQSLIWCGRVAPEKRPEVAVEAVAAMTDATLDIYGDGPARPAMESLARAHGASDRIRFHRSKPQRTVLAAMAAADALLYTSYGFDNQPMVLLEATAAGLPVFYCDPDMKEVCPPGGAVLVEGVDAAAFTKQLQATSLADMRAQRKAMVAGRSRVWQSVQTAAMVKVYREARSLYDSLEADR